jgi:hypothetical protein
MKSDLFVVLGEVTCSHPAKSAIVHSEHYFTTLNSSIRDVFFRELLQLTSTQSPGGGADNPGISGGSNSPRSSSPAPSTIHPVSPVVATGLSALIDDSGVSEVIIDLINNSHVIIAITPGMAGAKILPSCQVVGSASAGEKFLSAGHLVAIQVENRVSEYLKRTFNITPGPGGVSVETLSIEGNRIACICVCIGSSKLGSFVRELALEISEIPGIDQQTHICVKNVNRSRASGRSSLYVGKDWSNPYRYGNVLARMEAVRLVREGFCDTCEVQFAFADTAGGSNPLNLVNVEVNTFGTVKNERTDRDLRDIVWSRCVVMEVDEIRKMFLEANAASGDFFALGHGGSKCAPQYIRG